MQHERDAAQGLQLLPHAKPGFERPAQPAHDDRHATVTHLGACLQDVNVPGQPGQG